MTKRVVILVIVNISMISLFLSIVLPTMPFIKEVLAQSTSTNIQNNTEGEGLTKIENATSSLLKKDIGKLKELLSTPFTIITAISEVPEVQVSGINFGATELTVTLKQVNQSNSTFTNSTTPVTVVALRIPVSDLEDMLSIIKDSRLISNKANPENIGSSVTGPLASLIGGDGGLLGSQGNSDSLSSIKPFQLLKDIQFGTGSIVGGDWQYPRTITMGLLDISSFFGIENNPGGPASAHLLTIFVVPYVGITDMGSISLH